MSELTWCYSLSGNYFERGGSTRQEALAAAWRQEFDDGGRPDEVWTGRMSDAVVEEQNVCNFDICLLLGDITDVRRQTLDELRNYPE